MSKEQTMVKECFTKIGERFDGITRSLKRNPMPYDAECEYVTIPAGNYVDTGISPQDKGFGMKWELPNAAENTSFVNGSLGNSSQQQNPYYQIYWGSNRPSVYSIYVPGIRADHTVTDLNGIHYAVFVRGTTSNTSSFFIDGHGYICNSLASYTNIPSFYLGAQHNYDGTAINIMTKPLRIYNCNFNQLGIPTNFFIPVRKGSDGFLYDLFTKQMIGSATDTPLIPGPDKI